MAAQRRLMKLSDQLRFVPCGDRALMIYLGEGIDPAVNRAVLDLARAIGANRHPAIIEITSSYHCLLVEYDPVRIRLDQLQEIVRKCLFAPTESVPPRTVEIPVCYGGEMGPDLIAVAEHAHMSATEVIQRHTAPTYRVYCLGFSPGFPYLGGLDPAIATPRLADPRVSVPGGSVGIAGNQTGVYPAPSPGGWQLIGRTPAHLFDPEATAPAMVEPGDSIRFVPITPEQFQAQEQPRKAPALPEWKEGRTGLRVLQPGLLTTIQDLGRRGHMSCGVTVAGAADYLSLMAGNWLLVIRARTSALDMTISGPDMEFTGPVAFCLTGAPLPAELIPADGSAPQPVPGWTALLAGPGDRLRTGTATTGCRSYLCVAGGFDLPLILGSLSEDLFGKIGPLGRPLKTGDWLPVGLPLHPPANLAGRSLPADTIPTFPGELTVRVLRGPQADSFTPEAKAAFFGSTYAVGAKSDRQGLRMDGPRLQAPAGILSEPVAPGSIQVPASGQPILLMGNRQTTGGYAQIAVAVYSDLARAAQLRPGDRIRFQEIDLAEATSIVWSERRRLAQIRRYLERETNRPSDKAQQDLARQIKERMAQTAGANQSTGTTPIAAAALSEPDSAPVQKAARVLRLTIGGIEYEALIEEVPE
ncbi:MAG: 5-oxoprolinase subunit PxpB [Mycobacterium leprae]